MPYMQDTADRNTPQAESEYLTVKEMARELRVSPRTAWRWVAEGIVPSTRVGGARRIARADLEYLIETGRNKAS
jgi:excisionase family DNA binding protein